MIDDLISIPPMVRGFIEGMRAATRQKWIEATITYFYRAIINRAVAIECQSAGLNDAAEYFEQKAVWLIGQGLFCLSRSKQ